jgi:hypothetical protein
MEDMAEGNKKYIISFLDEEFKNSVEKLKKTINNLPADSNNAGEVFDKFEDLLKSIGSFIGRLSCLNNWENIKLSEKKYELNKNKLERELRNIKSRIDVLIK